MIWVDDLALCCCQLQCISTRRWFLCGLEDVAGSKKFLLEQTEGRANEPIIVGAKTILKHEWKNWSRELNCIRTTNELIRPELKSEFGFVETLHFWFKCQLLLHGGMQFVFQCMAVAIPMDSSSSISINERWLDSIPRLLTRASPTRSVLFCSNLVFNALRGPFAQRSSAWRSLGFTHSCIVSSAYMCECMYTLFHLLDC